MSNKLNPNETSPLLASSGQSYQATRAKQTDHITIGLNSEKAEDIIIDINNSNSDQTGFNHYEELMFSNNNSEEADDATINLSSKEIQRLLSSTDHGLDSDEDLMLSNNSSEETDDAASNLSSREKQPLLSHTDHRLESDEDLMQIDEVATAANSPSETINPTSHAEHTISLAEDTMQSIQNLRRRNHNSINDDLSQDSDEHDSVYAANAQPQSQLNPPSSRGFMLKKIPAAITGIKTKIIHTKTPAQIISAEPVTKWQINSIYPCFQSATIVSHKNLLTVNGLKLLGDYKNESHACNVLIPNDDPNGTPYKARVADGYVQINTINLVGMHYRYQSFKKNGEKLWKRLERRFHRAMTNNKSIFYACNITIIICSILIAALVSVIKQVLSAKAVQLATQESNLNLMSFQDEDGFNRAKAILNAIKGYSIGSLAFDGVNGLATFITNMGYALLITMIVIVLIDMHARQTFHDVVENIVIGEDKNVEFFILNNADMTEEEKGKASVNYVQLGKKYYVIENPDFLREHFAKVSLPQLQEPDLLTPLSVISDIDSTSSSRSDSSTLSKSLSLGSISDSSSTSSYSSAKSDTVIYQAELEPSIKKIYGQSVLAKKSDHLVNILNNSDLQHQIMLKELKTALQKRQIDSELSTTESLPQYTYFKTAPKQEGINDYYSILGTNQVELIATLRAEKENHQYRQMLAPLIEKIKVQTDLENRMHTLVDLANTEQQFQKNKVKNFPHLISRASLDRNFPEHLPSFAELASLNQEYAQVRDSLDSHHLEIPSSPTLQAILELKFESLSEEAYEQFLNFCNESNYFNFALITIYCAIKQQPLRVWVEKAGSVASNGSQKIQLDEAKSYLPDTAVQLPIDILYQAGAEPCLQLLETCPAPSEKLKTAKQLTKALLNSGIYSSSQNLTKPQQTQASSVQAPITYDELKLENYISQEVSTQLEELGLIAENVPGDGNCFYNALLPHLENDMDVKTLRALVVTELKNNKELHSFLELAGKTIEQHINSIEHGNEWADNVEIMTLIKTLQQPILVIEEREGKLCIVNRQDNQDVELSGKPPIFVYFNPDKAHYLSLIIKPGKSANEIKQALEEIINTEINPPSSNSP